MSGIISLYSFDRENIVPNLFYGTVALQHRGEEGFGVGVIDLRDKDAFKHIKKNGIAFYGLKDKLDDLSAGSPYAGIGHTLYEKSSNLQPVKQWSENYRISLGMDGVLLGFDGKGDSVMKSLYSESLKETKDFFEAGEILMEKLDGRGPYNAVMVIKNGENVYNVIIRDPKGFRPLCIGQKGNTYIAASETKALDSMGADFIRDVEPGELIVISDAIKGDIDSRILKKDEHAHCAFEWVYFGDPVSTIEGKNVYLARKNLGKRIARRYTDLELDMLLCSPDSGRGVTIGCQQEMSRMNVEGILSDIREMNNPHEIKEYLERELPNALVPFEEAVTKNSAAKRTFQVEDPKERELAAHVKFFVNNKIIRGNKAGIGDDSIVRGTVMKEGMVYKFKKAGVTETSAIISCPPLKFPCVKDLKNKEFIAHGISGSPEEVGIEVAEKLGMSRVCYPSIEDLDKAIGLTDTCKACFDGKYPVREEFL